MIESFRGEYNFLSNFYNAPITYYGITYRNNEAAFQAQKLLNNEEKKAFCNLTGKESKFKGRRVKMRDDWNQVKDQIMYEIIFLKFMQNKDLKAKLLATGDELIQENNTWNDTYWGVCNGKGENKLGKILMKVRSYIKNLK